MYPYMVFTTPAKGGTETHWNKSLLVTRGQFHVAVTEQNGYFGQV